MTSRFNEGKTRKLMKTVTGITMSAAIIGTSLTGAMAQGNEYPYSSYFPNGIEDADISVFTESEIEYPLNMSFETNEEIEFVKANSQEEQISLSEDAYEGRFALDVKPASDEKLLVKKTGDFTVGETMVSPAVYSLRTTSADGISVSVDDKQISVSGVADAGKEVTIILFDENGSIAYVDQTNSGEEGIFEFNFMVSKYGTYTMKLGNVASSTIKQTITVDGNAVDETITDTTVKVPEEIDTMTNIVRLWIKPKYKAESISFYVTAVCAGTEKQLKILGDKDNDGVFKVPEDLALGKWQQITLDLLKLEKVPDSTVVKNFYISANEGSEWVIDSAESEYREINGNEVDLEQFAYDNINCDTNGNLLFESLDSGIYSNSSKITTGYFDTSEKILNIDIDSEFLKIVDGSNSELAATNNKVSFYDIPGYSSGVWSGDYKKLYYRNSKDKYYIYCYDTTNYTSEKILEKNAVIYETTYTGNKLMFKDFVYDIDTKESVELPSAENTTYYLSHNGDIFCISGSYERSAYKYKDGAFNLITDGSVKTLQGELMCFNAHNDVFLIALNGTWKIYRNEENGCKLITSFYAGDPDDFRNVMVTNDGNGIRYFDKNQNKYFLFDILVGKTQESFEYVKQVADGRYLVKASSIYNYSYELYDPITGEKEYIYVASSNYCPERNQLLSIVDGQLKITDLNMNTEHNKYLLSFDGKKTWYAYDGGRWVVASVSAEPTLAEMKKSGMTKEEINAIPEEAYAKLYENGNEVYTLNFAIGMFGTTEYITPVVKSITVNTIANQPVDSIYSSKLFTFNKSDYNKVSGVFPVEDFPKVSECYFLLYLGNDWVYTYKDGAVKKLDTSVDKLMEDVNSSWLDIKQAGLNASELRSIPESVLTELFVNEKFANDKFGVIAVSKIKDDSTMDYGVEIKLSAETKYIAEEGYVLEISLNGAEKVVYTPADITKAQIDDFLAWLDERQNGGGNIFYRMQTENNQNFINYYNITNVNVYKESDTTEE